jgi:hypothetical protein
MHVQTRQIVNSGTSMTAMGATATAATGDMSGAITSDPVDLLQCMTGCIEAIWTATSTPVGTWVVEASGGSFDQNRPGNINWYDITSLITPALAAVNGAGSFLINIGNLGFRAIRVRYVRTSGGQAGNLNMWFFGHSAA